MKQTIRKSPAKKLLSSIAVSCSITAAGMLAGCSSSDNSAKEDIPVVNTSADLVVYGKIFTSESGKIVEAFAVKDGKYVYVGDKKGAEVYVEAGKTEVVDYTDKGLVMPGCGNGHSHYMLGYALKSIGTLIGLQDDSEKLLKEIVPAAVKKARAEGATSIFAQGWRLQSLEANMPTRLDLDAICSDIPIYLLDEECHKALANTILLKKAGIIKEDGTAGRTTLRGGEIVTDADGMPTGLLKEQAQTYVRSFLDNDNLYTLGKATANLAEIEQYMHSVGYTMYCEGWGNYFVNTNYYQAAQELDKAGKLHFVLGLPYEIESWMDMDEALARAIDAKKFETTRVIPRWIKLLFDGGVEAGTGIVDPLYPDGHQGIANWTEEEVTELTRKANANGLVIHIHVMGNKGVNQVVNAFVNGGQDEMRNTLVHVRNVNTEDYLRMAQHNIYVTSGVTWHHFPAGAVEYIREHGMTPVGYEDKAYPFKSYFDYGIPATIHSDYPALSGSPDDPFGIMEIAVTGVLWSENGTPLWTEELVSREEVLTALTINCAKQMFVEDERGSISTGKYADFLLLNQDVLTCPVNQIHATKPAATYFEGKKVFSM
jgi:predicted amidohydrolase YtcJ